MLKTIKNFKIKNQTKNIWHKNENRYFCLITVIMDYKKKYGHKDTYNQLNYYLTFTHGYNTSILCANYYANIMSSTLSIW